MRPFQVLTACAIVLGQAVTSVAAQCQCGPDFCQSDPRVGLALQAKKAALESDGYPERLISLIDVGDQCVARIRRSPDIFTMWLVFADGTKQTVPWSQEDESRAKQDVEDGILRRFWIYSTSRAFSCCGEPSYDRRSDYDAEDDVNTSTAILCKKGGCQK